MAGDAVRGTMVFVSFREVNQEIFVKELPDGEERNLTNNPADDFDPDLSDDGSLIAFASTRSGSTQVWVMDADGGNVRQLTGDNQGGQTPRFSRDGSRIAFSHGGNIGVISAAGGAVTDILIAQPEATAEPCRAGAFIGGWSPGDTHIIYYSASATRGIGQVCMVPAEGGEPEVLVSGDGYFVEPVMSPDGSKVVYRAIIGGQHDIWVLDLASGESVNLTNDADADIEPDWSPDGDWIAYGSLRPGAPFFDLYVMRADGSNVQRVTTDPAKEANPVWGP